MTRAAALILNRSGAAVAEMALVTPLLLIIMCGSFEIGNYFLDEHILVKAVRDGARFAARQDFTFYPDATCNGTPTAVGNPVLANTRNVVKTGQVSGGTDRLPFWNATTTITVTMTCKTTALDLGSTSRTMSGIYKGRTSGAPIVTVSATVPYTSVLKSFGFRGAGLNLNATQQAAVMGI